MADYFSQTVIRPDIPRTAMTALEYQVLAQMFDHEDVGEDVYFCASHGPNDMLFLDLGEVKALLGEDEGVASGLADLVRQEMAKCDPDGAEFELDMSMIGFEGIFQDIVRRSALDYIEVEAAWTCSKMRPDGFGGAATLITTDDIETVSTAGWLEEAIARLSGDAPG
ncbi:hypothetical protein [Sphingopyxis sp.]|uniref:hypothetical protein n=1 Tax=Sphingopyxis sp. TaxID=1908224 RepID=UPI002D7815CE|nr:hypothetical protein [Sphingopyxis sp.]HET6523194.1 hypothetical protein [Sphingopyxis sp.]